MEIEEVDNYLITLKRKGTVKRSPQSTTCCIQRSGGFVEGRLSPRRWNSRRRFCIGSTHCHGNQGRVATLVILLGWLRPVPVVRETIGEWLQMGVKKQVFQFKEDQELLCRAGYLTTKPCSYARFKHCLRMAELLKKTLQVFLSHLLRLPKEVHLGNFSPLYLIRPTCPFSVSSCSVWSFYYDLLGVRHL